MTGALLGRYLAEERSSGKMLHECYNQACENEATKAPSASAAAGEIAARLDKLEAAITKLAARL